VQQTRGSLAEPFKWKRQGALAHHRRLRGRAHDPQRPGVLECGGCEGRSAPSLYCWYVWIGSLIHLVIAPTSRSIPKLQHYPKMDLLQIGTSLNVASTLYHTWKGSCAVKGRPDPVGGRNLPGKSCSTRKQSEREGLATVHHEASDAKGPARPDQRALRP